MMETLRFKHPYYKLRKSIFPTCRGKRSIMKYQVDTTVKIETPNGDNYGVIIDTQLRRIKDLSLTFLKIDGNYPGHDITSHFDFIELLNSFRRFHKIESSENFVCVIWVVVATPDTGPIQTTLSQIQSFYCKVCGAPPNQAYHCSKGQHTGNQSLTQECENGTKDCIHCDITDCPGLSKEEDDSLPNIDTP